MHGPLPEVLQKMDSPHIQKPAQKALQAILAPSVPARMMLHRDLRGSKSVHRRQRWHHAVHFPIHRQSSYDFGPIALETAVVVVQLNLVHAAQDIIKDPAGQHLVPGVVTRPFPARYDIKTLPHFIPEPWNFFRVILQVGIHRRDKVTLAFLPPGGQGLRLANVYPEPDRLDVFFVLSGELPDDSPAAVRTSIIYKDNLPMGGQICRLRSDSAKKNF